MNGDNTSLTITLSVELIERVRGLVSAGVCASEEDVIRSAIHEAIRWSNVSDGTHASLEQLVGEIPEDVTKRQQVEESA